MAEIVKETKDFYLKILHIKDGFESINKKPNERKNHILVSKNFLSKNEILIHNLNSFIFHLWDNPKIMYNIIIHSDSISLKNKIIPLTFLYLIINNFYENIFSSNIIENKLLYHKIYH